MDDLSGLDWSAAPSSNTSSKPPPMNPINSFNYPALRPTPSPLTSGRNTPLSTQGSGNPGGKQSPAPSKPAPDSFSNLISFGSASAKSNANLSLREQQERQEAEKRKKEEERRKLAHAQFGNGQFFDALAQRQTSTPRTASPAISPPVAGVQRAGNGKTDSDDDLFAAFNANTKVDNSSYYPPPASGKASPANAPALNLGSPSAWNQAALANPNSLGDDDDPFGLNQLKSKPAPVIAQPIQGSRDDEDDDLLGDLGKPVDQVRKKAPAPSFAHEPEPGKAIEDSSSDSEEAGEAPPSDDPFDQAVAQLVDYGFTAENARRALTESGAGLNVQAAVNWLLDDAHRQAKEKANAKKSAPSHLRADESRSSSRSRTGSPAWMSDEGSKDGPSRRDNRSPAAGDNDLAKTAAAMGTSFLKSANSLWKTGQKKVQKAVAEFQQDGDPSQPKWMRSAQQDQSAEEGRRRAAPEATDEALMLESGMRPGRRDNVQPKGHSNFAAPDDPPRLPTRPAAPQSRPNPVPKWQQSSQPSLMDPRSRINKQAVEEQSSHAYISPARRRKATPQPPPEAQPKPTPEPEVDLLFNSRAPAQSRSGGPSPAAKVSPINTPSSRQSPAPRPAPKARPPRPIPQVSAIALKSSTQHREAGTAHFKRGDYAAAHASYTSSLSAIPREHPLAIILLCNRSLTSLKTGEPRQAVDDADDALRLIGPDKGEGEHVELHGDVNEKRDMRELYGKALTRKAEALEQMEKWAEAGTVWQSCIESGLGGQTATAGRQRCQKALTPKPAVKPTPQRAPAARPRPAASQQSSEAVARLRAANAAADKEGDEKFALADKVDARIATWRDGKRDNLRALLGSLENVLWEGSGWKKVGLHELVMANKVKIIYMKAIAKTHPDKIAQDASTEVRMIAGTVFSTLNEAWDKFKAENGL